MTVPGRARRRVRAVDHRAGAARRHPDGRVDAGHGRLRDLPSPEAEQGAGACAGHLHDRAERHRAHHQGPRGRRRRLCHQAARAGRASGAHSRASRQCPHRRTARARRSTRSAGFSWRRATAARCCGARRRRRSCSAPRSAISTPTNTCCRATSRTGCHQCAAASGLLAAANDRSQVRCVSPQAAASLRRPDRARREPASAGRGRSRQRPDACSSGSCW